MKTTSIKVSDELLSSEESCLLQAIQSLAQVLDVNKMLLTFWVKEYFLPKNLPFQTKISFLHIASKHLLDPIVGEVSLWQTDDKRREWHTQITLDGWMRILHRQDQFCGITTIESRDPPIVVDGNIDVPHWMECSIYRVDCILPITTKEYFYEVKSEHITWKKFPRRMLRHRVISQCTRLAFGINLGEASESLGETVLTTKPVAHSDSPKEDHLVTLSRSQALKEKLQG